MLSSIMFAAAVAAPQPTQLKTFTDWTVGCDNGRACQAVALLPEGRLEGVRLVLTRDAGSTAPLRARFAAEGPDPAFADLRGRRIKLRNGQVADADMAELLRTVRSASAIPVRDGAGRTLGAASLKGASAAMLYMDEAQRRAGTVTALVRPGVRPARTVPPPPALPTVARPQASGLLPARVDRAALIRHYAGAGCDRVATPEDVTVRRLDRTQTLVLVPDRCGSGAYNAFSIALIADDRSGVRPATFDAPAGIDSKPTATAVNPDWDPAERVLSTYAKGRGIGDCGVRQRFVWSGQGFRLIEQSAMGECRGSRDYITTWRAAVR